MRKTTVATLSAIGLVSLCAGNAHAQAVAGALQLGLGTGLISYTSPTFTHQVPFQGGTAEYKLGTPTTTWGFASRNGVTLEAGYGLDDMFVIGGLMQLGGWSQSYETTPPGAGKTSVNSSTFDFFLGPKFDVMFLPGYSIRPFVGAAIGFAHYGVSQETQRPVLGGTTTERDYDGSWNGVGLMLRGGIRWFLTPGFSIDPSLVLGYTALAGSMDLPAPGQAATINYDAPGHSWTIGLNVGLSGWVGL